MSDTEIWLELMILMILQHLRKRRMLNISRDLDWDTYFEPVLSDYMKRMKKAGYITVKAIEKEF